MNTDVKSLWEKCLPLMQQELPSISFSTWIKPLVPVSMDVNSIILSTDNDILKTMVISRYIDLIKNVIFEITGKEYTISIKLDKTDEITQEEEAPLTEEKKAESHSSKYTFDNFIVGNSNRFAHAAALAVAESPATAYNPLFIYGGVGLGKTHLMYAIKNYIQENNKNAKIAFVTSENFMYEVIQAIRNHTTDQLRKKYREADVLLIDDIQFIAGKTSTEEEFFHTFNALVESNKQIVVTSDRPPREIKTFDARVRSRLESDLICDIAPPDFETRFSILERICEEERVRVDSSIISFIAERVTSNIRELEGIFTRVLAYRGLLQEEITMDTVIKVMKDYSDDGKKILTPQFIVEYCSKFYNIIPEKVYSSSRKNNISFVRQICFYICREILDMPYTKIGQVFGRDHTTVMSGIKQVEKNMEKDESFKNTVLMLMKDIENETA